jgi:hypothetical protein
MSKVYLFIFSIFAIVSFNQHAYADSVQSINAPTNCFVDEDFCSRAEIKEAPKGSRYIDFQFYGKLNNEYADRQEIIERFLDFKSWIQYATGAQEINIISSGILSSRTYLGFREITQYSRYNILAPWPTKKINVVERTTYREARPKGNIAIHWNFHSDRDFAQQGIKRKDGSIKIQFIAPSNVYHLKLDMQIIPSTGYLVAARKSIRHAISRLFSEMYNLN